MEQCQSTQPNISDKSKAFAVNGRDVLEMSLCALYPLEDPITVQIALMVWPRHLR